MEFVVVESHGEEVKAEMKKAIEKALNKVGAKARQYSKDRYCPVKTGKLKNSIHYRYSVENGQAMVELYSDCDYAPYVEMGHHQEPGRYVPAIGKRLVRDWVPPKPFMRPAIERHTSEYKRMMKSVLKNGS